MFHNYHNGNGGWTWVVRSLVVCLGLCCGHTFAQSTVSLGWDAETTSLVAGFHVYSGTQSGQYTNVTDVGPATTATITNLEPDTTYYFAIAAYGTAGLDSAPSNEVVFTTGPVANNQTVLLLFPTATVINAMAPGSAASDVISHITSPLNGVASINGNNTITYTPNSSFAGQDGFSYTVTNASGASVTGSITIVSRVTFSGLITNSSSTTANTGLIQLQTAGAGWFTGKLMLGNLSTPISGVFDANGSAVLNVKTKSGATVTLDLNLDTATGEISGTMTTGSGAPSTIGASMVAYSATNKAPQAGIYTIILPPNPAAESDTPQGIGYCRLIITDNGLARLTGILADQTVISYTAPVAADGTLSVYESLYSGGGYMGGVLKFETITTSGSESDLDGVIAWQRPPDSDPNAAYPAGFSTTIDAVGSLYVPAAANSSETAVTLVGTDLSTPISDSVSLIKPGLFRQRTPARKPLTLQFNTASGLFSGSFLDPVSNTVRKFGGVVFQKRAIGAGSFFAGHASGSVVLKKGA
jgi:hypothetical protein